MTEELVYFEALSKRSQSGHKYFLIWNGAFKPFKRVKKGDICCLKKHVNGDKIRFCDKTAYVWGLGYH